jgi:hypothetical protein
MRRIAAVALAFGAMVAAIEAIRVATAWWKGQLESIGAMEALLLAALPAVAWAWWRYYSIFGRKEPKCLLPEEPAKRDGPSAS